MRHEYMCATCGEVCEAPGRIVERDLWQFENEFFRETSGTRRYSCPECLGLLIHDSITLLYVSTDLEEYTE